MLFKKALKVTLVIAAIGLAAAIVTAQDDSETQAKIANAMSAAPLSIAENATIMDHEFDAEGSIVILREGTNGWTCFPDFPGSPGNDPACYDETWMQWLYAYLAGEEPNISTPGLSYRLQGSSDASNTDPFAMEPATGEEWIASPPHIMIVVPGKLDTSLFSTDPESGEPWIMFARTPYAHIMMPVSELGRDQ